MTGAPQRMAIELPPGVPQFSDTQSLAEHARPRLIADADRALICESRGISGAFLPDLVSAEITHRLTRLSIHESSNMDDA